MMQQDVLTININSKIVAFILSDFQKSDQYENHQNEINQVLIDSVIKEKNINLIITTRNKKELKFIQDQHIITVSQKDDHETIQEENMEILKHQGNFLYLFDNYILMLKYIISLKLIDNNTQDIHNLDNGTYTLVINFELQSFFNSFGSYLSSRSTQIPNFEPPHQLPQPIQIPQFVVLMKQNFMN